MLGNALVEMATGEGGGGGTSAKLATKSRDCAGLPLEDNLITTTIKIAVDHIHIMIHIHSITG